MKQLSPLHLRQKGERRIAAALRITLVFVLLGIQIAFILLSAHFLEENATYLYTVMETIAVIASVHLYNNSGNLTFRVSWIIVMLTLPVVGLTLYLLWGGALQQRASSAVREICVEHSEGDRLRNDVRMDELRRTSPQWGKVARCLERRNFHIYRDTQVRYLAEGAELIDDLIARMAQAEHFIFLEYFILAEGKVWDRIFEVLCDRANHGVEVKIIFDDFGNIQRFRGETIDSIRSAGMELIVFNPVHRYVNRLYFNYRDHRKIAVIDGMTAYTGGVNIADEYANLITRHGYWKDGGVRLDGEAAWGFTRLFLEMWTKLGGQLPNETDYYRPHGTGKGSGFCQPFTDGPSNNPDNPAEETYLQIISNARHMLYITTPYFIVDDTMLRALCIAGDGGVDVRLMLPDKPDHRYTDLVAESYYGELLRHGVRIYRYVPGFLHCKNIMADREIAVSGSVNMDYRSFEWHYECGVVLYGAAAIEQMFEDMDSILKQSREITLEEWEKRGWWRKLVSMLLRLFAILM